MTTLPNTLAAQCRIATPLGPLTLAATAQGLAGAWFDGQAHHPGPLAAPVDPTQRWLREAAGQLQAYFAGGLRRFTLPLDAAGTPFQQAVWQALCTIPAGATRDYGAIAAALGRPQAARAVGAAVGRNPVSIVVPCHRVLGRDGSLTGYSGGLDRKRALLALEGALPLQAAA
jgi:methylated-DNA-[protein]-cysteine S-methyltransferase